MHCSIIEHASVNSFGSVLYVCNNVVVSTVFSPKYRLKIVV